MQLFIRLISLIVLGNVLMSDSSLIQINNLKIDSSLLNSSCFDGYLERLHNVSNNYQTAYQKCIEDFNSEQLKIHEYEKTQKQEILDIKEDICSSFDACNSLEDAFEFFTCTKETSLKNIDKMNDIKAKSAIVLINMSVEYSEAEKALNICTTEAQRAYDADIQNCMTELNSCLALESGSSNSINKIGRKT